MWYVIQVYTGKEADIVEQCKDRVVREDEDIFIPVVERMTKVQGEWVQVRTRLFPGYVFIETDRPWELYMRLKGVKAMTKLLKTGEEITPLYREEEKYLRRLQDREHVVRYSEGFMEGDRLVVTSGPLQGSEGEIKKILRHKRLVVMEVPLLGRKVEVTLGLGVVEKKE